MYRQKQRGTLQVMSAIALGAAVVILRSIMGKSVPVKGKMNPITSAGQLVKLNTTELTTRRYMIYFIIPVWIAAGLLDWYWHRKTKIETTAGKKESGIHALMMAEVGIPVMAALFLEVNAAVLLLMLGAFLVHEATAMWDVAYASDHRDVRPREQHTHSFLNCCLFAPCRS